jgi:hypothetical protein
MFCIESAKSSAQLKSHTAFFLSSRAVTTSSGMYTCTPLTSVNTLANVSALEESVCDSAVFHQQRTEITSSATVSELCRSGNTQSIFDTFGKARCALH